MERVARWLVLGIAALLAAALVPAVTGALSPAEAAVDPCIGAPRAPYVDVPDAHAHAHGIDCLAGLRVIQGRDVDAFEPATTLRRDQMATIVAGAIEAATGDPLPAGSRGAFDDLAGNVHRDAIEALARAGVVEGRGPGRYDPHARVPRGQMTAFLVRAHDLVLGPATSPPPDAFDDDAGHPHEATIDRAADLGLANGRTPSEFQPQELTRRDQTASFVARVLAAAADGGVMRAPSWEPTSRTSPLPARLRTQMTGVSWRPGCPVGLDDLRLLETVHRGFDGRDRTGLLVLHRDAVADVDEALRTAYDAGSAIQRMRLIDRYGGDDDRSMDANNTSAFNCRPVAGTSRWSQHAYGRAIDLNPVQNPYVTGSSVSPSAGRAYTDRGDVRRGMVVRGDAVVRAFADVGWGWGGDFQSSKDWQHFSATGG